MKTSQQRKFEKLIENINKNNAFVIDRKGVLQDFWEDSDLIYDLFCDSVFQFLESKKQNSLFIDERGFIHNNASLRTGHHIYFEILSSEDIKQTSDDIIYYIDISLNHLEEQLNSISRSVK